jgi:hypothetical protein
MADNADAPQVKDLPKLDDTIKGELTKDIQLKHIEVHEKVVLPSAEDLKQEKVHEGLLKGVETFSPDHLKPTKTREPASATEVMQVELAQQASLKAVEQFDKNALKNVDTQEKNPLPDQDAIKLEEEHLKFKDGIENFDKDKLAKTPTVEKNTLPTKEVIDLEKKAE